LQSAAAKGPIFLRTHGRLILFYFLPCR
jgi:hypothetical protein